MSSTLRSIAIITLLAENYEYHSLSEIAKQLDISKGTAHRILTSLKNVQWVHQDASTKKYRIGNRAQEVGFKMTLHLNIENISLPFLYQLRDATEETAMLCIRVGLERVYIQQIPGKQEVRQIVEIGKLFPLWNGAPGIAILTYLTPKEIEQVIEQVRNTPNTTLASGQKVTVKNLMNEMEQVKKLGYATSFGKRIANVGAVSAPIFGNNHRVMGALCIGGPIERFSRSNVQRFGTLITESAKMLSTKLGNSVKL